jgi:multiple sugar transport system ATP-binding protein
MGRAIVREPQVFLFDEPLSNLDAKLRVQMRTEIKELHQRLGDHLDLRHPRPGRGHDLADKIVVMNAGHRRAGRRAARPLRQPGNLFVAGFIGSPPMNLQTRSRNRSPAGARAQRRRARLPRARS